MQGENFESARAEIGRDQIARSPKQIAPMRNRRPERRWAIRLNMVYLHYYIQVLTWA